MSSAFPGMIRFDVARARSTMALLLAAPLLVQGLGLAQPQPGDTGRISGRVVAAQTGIPLRRAQVSVTSRALRRALVVLTDPQGRYELPALPPGVYRLSAAKAGYLPLRFGADDALAEGDAVDLRARGTLTGIDFHLPRAGVIAGFIVDEYGDPVADASVRTMRYQSRAGQRRLVTASRTRRSDDQGRFRLFGLLPGEYFVQATAQALQTPDRSQESPDAALRGFAPTYYPGTPNLAEAWRVSVDEGEEVQVAFGIMPTRVGEIVGGVVDANGAPAAGASVTLIRRAGTLGSIFTRRRQVREDGTFGIGDVAPGSYVVQVSRRQPEPPRRREFALASVVVNADTPTQVFLATRPGGSASGWVVNEGSEPPDFGPTAIEIAARPALADVRAPAGESVTRVRSNWTFELSDLYGAYLLRATRLPYPWSIKALRLNGQDVTDAVIDFTDGESTTGIELVLTDQTSVVSGRVIDRNDVPASRCSVVLFAESRTLWTPQSRFVRIAQTDASGQFRVIGLPAERYFAVAVPYVWQGEWTDSAFLERIRSRAIRFRLGGGEERTVDLGLSTLP